MTGSEITRLIQRYIGVSTDGYLGNFNYNSHAEFYPLFCNLDIDPRQYQGSTRVKFQEILRTSSPDMQARIVRGVLAKFPPSADRAERTQELHDEFLQIAQRLEGVSVVATPTLTITSDVVERALTDAETLIRTSGATSGVDRIHTALHGYLRAACISRGIEFGDKATCNVLFNLLRERHPAFSKAVPRSSEISAICRAMGQVMDVLNPIRNDSSMAHPNESLLEVAEAMLVIHATRTILHYVDAKLRGET